MNMQTAFEPWKRDRELAHALMIVGAAAFAACAIAALFGAVAVATINGVLGFVVFAAATRFLRSAARREHGKRVEESAALAAKGLLEPEGFRLRTNVPARALGDIDLVVDMPDGKSIPVEIKSYVRWRQFLWFVGEREARAFKQISGQIRYLRAPRGIIWLPNGRPTLLQKLFPPSGRGVKVVLGDARRLRQAL